MDIEEGMAIIEAIMFAFGEPISIEKLAEASGIDEATTGKLVGRLERKYSVQGSGLRIIKLNNTYQMATREDLSSYVKSALENHRQTPLSQAALECLAVIAYNQPVTKGFVEQIRGIDSSGVVNTLVERGLIEEAGRLELPGRPIAYRTTDTFLRCFRIGSLAELPPLPTQEGQLSLEEMDGIDQQEIDSRAEELAQSLALDHGDSEDLEGFGDNNEKNS